MIKLLKKEFMLFMHPTTLIFLTFPVMLLIPNYPYYVNAFYMLLALFFACLSGRENRDVEFSLMLPIGKRDFVKARTLFFVIVEVVQLIIMIPFAIIRAGYNMPNEAFMDANIALFAFTLMLLGIYNFSFLTSYFKNPQNVGKTFAWNSILFFGVMVILEVLTFLPGVKMLDTPDPEHLALKLITLGVAIIFYVAVNFATYRVSAKAFERVDL